MLFSRLLKKTGNFSRSLKAIDEMAIHSLLEFRRILVRECARAERNGSHFCLVRFNTGKGQDGVKVQVELVDLLKKRIRLTDELGWLEDNQIGLLLYNTDADNAIRFVTDLKINGSSGISNFSYDVYIYPCDKPDDADHWPDSQKKQKISGQQTPQTERDQTSPTASQSQSHRLIDGADPQRSATATGKTDPVSIKTMLLRVPLWKRIFDIAGAFMGLAIFSPVFIVVSLYIKWVSPGPVFFKQERFGYGGRLFRMWKFRTMKVDADPSVHQQLIGDLLRNNDRPMKKLADDSRIMPLGNLLRKFCIDELPQLINVLRGEMSLVGPRPPIPYEVREYLRWHKGRFDIVPGMTGLWQVSGKNRLTFKDMIRLDIRYARSMSFWADLAILFKTPWAIIDQFEFDSEEVQFAEKGVEKNV